MLNFIRKLFGIPKADPLAIRRIRDGTRPLRVLVAEDNPVNQQLIIRLLAKHGHTPVVARSGKEVLAAMERERFDLVLMDVQMPEMDGLQATGAIRERERTGGGHIPIMAVTAHANREQCLAAGMDSFLAKPIQADELIAALNKLTELVETAQPSGGAMAARQAAVEVFNQAEALGRAGDDAEILGEVAAVYLADSPRILSQIRGAVARRDGPALQVSAHALKGAVSIFSASFAQEAALRMEKMGREGDMADAEEALAALEKEIERLRQALLQSSLVKGATG